jgi:hypothetical protein
MKTLIPLFVYALVPAAALVYQQVKEKCGSNIALSGHSLSGGLTSVMAVWIDRLTGALADTQLDRPNFRHKRRRLAAYKVSRELRA